MENGKIRKLINIVHDVASGDLDGKIPDDLKKDRGEVGELARVLDKLFESSHCALQTLVESKLLKRKSAITGIEKEFNGKEKKQLLRKKKS